MKLNLAPALLMAVCAVTPAYSRSVAVTSPTGLVTAEVTDDDGRLLLGVTRGVTPLLLPSPIGLDLESVSKPLTIRSSHTRYNIEERIEAPFYRQKSFTTRYNEAVINLSDGVRLTLRAADDGVAYRFSTTRKGTDRVLAEQADLQLPEEAKVWLAHSTNPEKPLAMAFQNTYTVTPVSSAAPLPAFLPVSAEIEPGLRLTVLESDLESYPGMFVSADSVSGSLKAVFAKVPAETDYYPWRHQLYVTSTADHIADVKGPRDFPWRILAVTTDDRQMPVNNLVYALASPARMNDVSWIRPGKVAWDWWNDWALDGVDFKAGINTETYKHFIDFASQHGLEYIVLDEGWYVPASGDMLTVIPEIDLQELVGYGKQRGVDIVLWTVFNVLDDQLEEACRKYADMGIAGFKVDFLDRDDQQAVDMAYRIAEACARHRLILDYHGFYKPTGLNRTYPNIINFEAVFGMEEMKWSDPSVDMPLYDVTFPYLRMMAGPVDYTPGAMRNATKADWRAVYSYPVSQGTRAHQLATYIVHDSPFTMLADSPSAYRVENECVDFIAGLPTVFDSTEIIDGRMGEYIVTMREADGSYFVGGMTSWTPRDYTLALSFLPEGKSYRATVMADGVNASKTARDYRRFVQTVDKTSDLRLDMAPGGGFALRLDPIINDVTLNTDR